MDMDINSRGATPITADATHEIIACSILSMGADIQAMAEACRRSYLKKPLSQFSKVDRVVSSEPRVPDNGKDSFTLEGLEEPFQTGIIRTVNSDHPARHVGVELRLLPKEKASAFSIEVSEGYTENPPKITRRAGLKRRSIVTLFQGAETDADTAIPGELGVNPYIIGEMLCMKEGSSCG
ncbi:hypothetical protein PAAG_01054 [Paracoccidioides lutzii Pb01]|uniref:Uncharacterized protein n=1 Tax=Paracoccidioides lutzii (strain ATCC MYA-826 / Pb01) TaxID=502779 RepID=C1GRA9_PARBA|nr:hypothetical protein PAAG_01054 [Paracoccidioides lutzii Pb01]EEH38133.2 hypothetical protein PAAG_01054 [Paracoccidioides lutzii Pb01]